MVDRFWAQGEWIQSRVESASLGNPVFSGFYGKAGVYLAGLNQRPFSRTKGAWSRVRPIKTYRGGNPFKPSNGGAWELVARVSTVDLNDGAIHGGALTDISAGINWYINPVNRIMFNYINSDVEDSGRVNIFLLRYQYAIE